MSVNVSHPAAVAIPAARWSDYLQMARLDHMTKHVFIIPGIVLAWMLRDAPVAHAWMNIVLGFGSAVLIASANYIINEWLDREFDAYHPDKSKRPAVNLAMHPAPVYAIYAGCVVLGMEFAREVGTLFLATTVLFWVSGVIYNVKPVRTKDKPYLDVLSESLNNPIRLMLGWAMVDGGTIAPSSFLIAYWMGGAFLMGAKRLSEYREIAAGPGVQVLHLYRRSFRHYTEERLTISCFVYALLATMLVGVFMVKYRIEYLLVCPLIIALFAQYLALSMRAGSVAQKPEKLFRETRLMLLSGLTAVAFFALSFVHLDWLQSLAQPAFINIGIPQ